MSIRYCPKCGCNVIEPCRCSKDCQDHPYTDWALISKSIEEKKAANPQVPWHITFNKRMGFTK